MNIKNLDSKKVLWKALALDTYFSLLENVRCLAGDNEDEIKRFKKKFNAFYRVRRNDNTWIEPFYRIFKEALNDTKLSLNSFSYYFDKVYENCIVFDKKTKRYDKHQNETSFVSKMLHTIKPDVFPILDSRVIDSLNLKKEFYSNPKDTYYKLVQKYNECMLDKKIIVQINHIKDFLASINTSGKIITDNKVLDILFYT